MLIGFSKRLFAIFGCKRKKTDIWDRKVLAKIGAHNFSLQAEQYSTVQYIRFPKNVFKTFRFKRKQSLRKRSK